MEFDVEAFIDEVRKQENIYNRDLCKDQEARTISWRIIGDITGKSDLFCQKKWKNLRDTYIREKKKSIEAKANADDASAKRRWLYFEQIDSFLAPHIRTYGVEGSSLKDIDLGLQSDSKSGELNDTNMDDYGVEAAVAAGNIMTSSRSAKPTSFSRLWKRKGSLRPVKLFRAGDRALRDHDVTGARGEAVTQMMADEDGLFGQSVASALRRLPGYKRALAKVKISQVLFDVEFQQVQNLNAASDATYQVIQPDVFQAQYPEVLQDSVAVSQASDPNATST